jgi:hypothetical protein
MANSKETSFNNSISSTLPLITVLFEDLFEAITIHKEFCDKKKGAQPSISLLNKTDTFYVYVGGYIFERGVIKNDENNALQKNRCCCLRVFVSLVTSNSTKIAFYFGGSKQDHVWK